ncbi:MAG: NUDIX domain-containing protein [Pseudomonadales bacterium]|nr:NUDIX domain-containing protein [Pseudomonadales bacterium]
MKYCPQCATELRDAQINGEPRKACPVPECGFVNWGNPTPVVAIIVELPEGVVLAHNVAWPAEFFSIITGFLEADEDPAECARRETLEELGLKAQSCKLVGVYPFAQQNQVIIAYHIEASGEIILNEELDAYRVVAPARLKPWRQGTGLALIDWMQAQGITAPR